MANTEPRLSMEELDLVVSRCISEEYQMTILVFPGHKDSIHVSLEKGSSYGGMHMKFSAQGSDLNETFNKCLRNFPANPVGAVWDSKRIAPPQAEVIVDGEFNEMPPERPQVVTDDDIPF